MQRSMIVVLIVVAVVAVGCAAFFFWVADPIASFTVVPNPPQQPGNIAVWISKTMFVAIAVGALALLGWLGCRMMKRPNE